MEVVYNFINWIDRENRKFIAKSKQEKKKFGCLYDIKKFNKCGKIYMENMKIRNVDITYIEAFLKHLNTQFEKFDRDRISNETLMKFFNFYHHQAENKYYITKERVNINTETGIIFDDDGIAIGSSRDGQKLPLSLKDVMICENQKWRWQFDSLGEIDIVKFISISPFAV